MYSLNITKRFTRKNKELKINYYIENFHNIGCKVLNELKKLNSGNRGHLRGITDDLTRYKEKRAIIVRAVQNRKTIGWSLLCYDKCPSMEELFHVTPKKPIIMFYVKSTHRKKGIAKTLFSINTLYEKRKLGVALHQCDSHYALRRSLDDKTINAWKK